MTTQHTSGSWIVKELHANYGGFVLMTSTSSGLKRLDDKEGKFTKETANLIAAAPDLLASCKEAENMIRALLPESLIGEEIRKRLVASIAKAEGKQ